MSSLAPVGVWVAQLKEGDPQAAQHLWNTYFLRMVKAARTRLQNAPGRMADEEDVALSAFKSFCRGTKDGRFPHAADHADPWPLLLALTRNKAVDLLRHGAASRGGARLLEVQSAGVNTQSDAEAALAELIGREPDPQYSLQIAEECQRLLDSISDSILRAIALWKMEGFTTEEIASKLGCTSRTVERKLQLMRKLWKLGDALS